MLFLRCVVAAAAALLASSVGRADGADSHVYAAGDEVEMLVNTVGPYSNPSETYQYYELPFCKPMHVEQRANSLGEVLEGSMKQTSMYEIRFGGKQTKRERAAWRNNEG
jgi:transmembrane 9 superfamily member 1